MSLKKLKESINTMPENIIEYALSLMDYTIEDYFYLVKNRKKIDKNGIYKNKFYFIVDKKIFLLKNVNLLSGVILPLVYSEILDFNIISLGNYNGIEKDMTTKCCFGIYIKKTSHETDIKYLFDSSVAYISDDFFQENMFNYQQSKKSSCEEGIKKINNYLNENLIFKKEYLFKHPKEFITQDFIDDIALSKDLDMKLFI